ncbi:hypothetical protein LINPERPRIM_LOCUS15015 [Linum perenne]
MLQTLQLYPMAGTQIGLIWKRFQHETLRIRQLSGYGEYRATRGALESFFSSYLQGIISRHAKEGTWLFGASCSYQTTFGYP